MIVLLLLCMNHCNMNIHDLNWGVGIFEIAPLTATGTHSKLAELLDI